MNNLTEQQIRAIVKDEMMKNYMSGNPITPPHSHNGTDGLNIDPADLIGFTPIPTTAQTYTNEETQLQEYGFGSPQQLASGDPAYPPQSVANTKIIQYPIPIVIGNAGSSNQAFEGGWAPEGTLVAFVGTVNKALFVRFDGQWLGAPLSVTI